MFRFHPSPKVASLRATFMGHFLRFWDIFWATIYEKSLTDYPARHFSREDGFHRPGPALSRGPGQPSSACVQPRSDPRTIHALSYGNHVDLHPAGSDRRPHLAGPVVPGREGRDIPRSLTIVGGQLDIFNELFTLPYLCFVRNDYEENVVCGGRRLHGPADLLRGVACEPYRRSYRVHLRCVGTGVEESSRLLRRSFLSFPERAPHRPGQEGQLHDAGSQGCGCRRGPVLLQRLQKAARLYEDALAYAGAPLRDASFRDLRCGFADPHEAGHPEKDRGGHHHLLLPPVSLGRAARGAGLRPLRRQGHKALFRHRGFHQGELDDEV